MLQFASCRYGICMTFHYYLTPDRQETCTCRIRAKEKPPRASLDRFRLSCFFRSFTETIESEKKNIVVGITCRNATEPTDHVN